MRKIGSSSRGITLSRALYTRFVGVVAILLALVGVIQLQSLHDALIVAGQSNLSFAVRDMLHEHAIASRLRTAPFSALAPEMLRQMRIRGINVRIYDGKLRPIGEQMSRDDPVHLIDITPGIAGSLNTSASTVRSVVDCGGIRMRVMQLDQQILLFAAVSIHGRVGGYVELGYRQSVMYQIFARQALQSFIISIMILLFAAVLLVPVTRAPLRPLHRFIQAAVRIREGDFQERLPVVGSSETIRLAEVMNEALEQLARAVEHERQATDKMKQFISAASHELRTPLTAIRGFTEVLLRRVASYEEEIQLLQTDMGDDDDDGDEESCISWSTTPIYAEQLAGMRQALQTMQRETGRLESLVRDLLQLARLDEGLQPNLERVDVAMLVNDLRSQLDVLSRGQIITYDLQSALTSCDRSMFHQILYNLVMNAIQYTSVESGVIEVRTAVAADGRAQLIVQDNGPGIPPDQRIRIFDRFYRASEARERNPGGAGLGLAIVGEIVRVHQGDIRVEGDVGKGTTMIVEL